MSYEPNEDYATIVLDNGSGTCQAGFAGDDGPFCVFPNIVGRRKALGAAEKDGKLYFGDEAQDKREILSLQYPMEHGVITDWELMEKVWSHVFYQQMHVYPEQHPVLMSEPPMNPKANSEMMAQVMFESFNTPAFYVGHEAALCLFSAGLTTGVMTNCGDGVTSVVPILTGYPQREGIKRIDFAGRDLTLYLQKLLYKKGHAFTTTAELDIVREMKEELCYVAEDKQRSKQLALNPLNKTASFKLPDGSFIQVAEERHLRPELLFQSDGVFHGNGGLTDLVLSSIASCDMCSRMELYSNVTLCGGSTMFRGFPERLQNELRSVAPKASSIRVKANPERKYHMWIGGSILASLSTFQRMWISKKEYLEYGPNIVHRKCL